jgi:hypothetical protein
VKRAFFFIALACLACGSKPRARDASSKRWREDPRALVAEVAAIRGLADSQPTPIVFDDAKTFARALDQKAARDAIGPTSADQDVFFSAFDFPPANAKVGSTLDEVLGEQIIAFYDQHTHSVHVRKDRPNADDDEMTMVLAHELAHSLQEQHLPVPDLRATTDADTRLAELAVIEGDAMLVMLAHAAYRRRIPLNRALARAAVMATDDAFQRYARASRADRALMRAPPLIRERLTFPYLRGLTFVGDVWRAGGFPLVNRMYAHAPTTTEQILHPEKYLAGEKPVPVREPEAPKGYEKISSGRVGELQIRVVLERCLPPARAAAAASGWGGDAYTIARSTNGKGALLWATVWDDETQAIEFETALKEYVSCTRTRSGENVMPAGDLVRRDQTKVVLTRGLSTALAETTTVSLLALISDRPAVDPPLGAVSIPVRKPIQPTRPPYVSQNIYVNERLGLMAQVPYGAAVDMKSPTSVVFSVRSPSTALAGIELSDQIAVGATIDEIHGTLAAAVQDAIGRYTLEYTGGQDVFIRALGHGVDRAWNIKGTTAGLRAIVIPICNGTGSFVIWQLWTDPGTAAQLEQWLASVHPTAWQTPPVCAELDP